MNRRRFLTSVPVSATYGFVAALVGRLFGSERRKRMSAGVLRREPWRMAGGDADTMASWEDGPGVDNVDRDKGIVYMSDGTMRSLTCQERFEVEFLENAARIEDQAWFRALEQRGGA